ncbi:trigger factor [Chromatocurvus halotolerans]|uniref:Trigger factor protein n=1 Tax=Chromatocurvus halotolerans TaxID=1132028 RepID=A0A4R2KN51_9GAMM|nr:trigger factor [Chromatocurvus halotolerans]TCO75133.1 trigger factor protein [Chromatocurvus halotolerans]
MEPARILAEHTDGLRHEYRVTLDPQQVSEAVDAQLRRAGAGLAVPGFRPGRAPLAVLRSHHGRRLRNDVVDRLAIGVARRLIAERGLSPLGRPSIHIDTAAPETFVLTVEVTPEITLGHMADIHIHRLQVENGDAGSKDLAQEYVRRQLFDALIAQCAFPVPGDWVDTEYAVLIAGYRDAVGEEPDPATRSDLEAIAERRIRLALLLSEVARGNAIEVPRSEVEQRVEQIADRDPEHQNEIIDYYLDHPTAMAELQSPLLEARVVDFILEHCHISEETVDAEHLRMLVLGDTADAS